MRRMLLFFSQAEDGIRDLTVTGVQTCALPICRRLSRRSGSNFYLGFLLLPQEKRWAMEALYAFMRYSDDLIDEAPQSGLNGHLESAIDQRLDRLERWRSILEIAFADLGRLSAGSIPEGESKAMFLLPALVDTVKRFNIPVEHLYA